MIANYSALVIIINVTRVLIEQMLHLIFIIEHQHQRDDSQFSTGTRRQIADTTFGIVFDSSDKSLHIAAFQSLSCLGIHLAGILIRRIMGEVAAHNKEILIRKIGLQHLSHPFQFAEVVGGYDNRYNGRHLFCE